MSMEFEESTVESELIYKGRVVSLRLDTVQLANGRTVTREIVQHRGAVAIVPLLDNSTVLLVRQYRQAVGEALLEIPAGTLEENESPETCAIRELEEETGYTAKLMQPMFSQYLAPGYSQEVLHVFLAEELSEGSARPEEDEQLELVETPVSEVAPMVLDGRIRDAKTIAGLLVTLRLLGK
ncbi:MAG: NUDIX hydrolase [Fimbriimonadia bacterium]|nr:NUDIX hydrolase [Fimbriimonadia bacterium]